MPLRTLQTLTWPRWLVLSLAWCLASLLAGCETLAPTAPMASHPQTLEAGVQRLGDDLVAQLHSNILERMRSRHVVLDPFIDASSGQQTTSGVRAGQRLVQRLAAKDSGLRIEPFDADGVRQADYLIAGTLTKGRQGQDYTLSATVTERRTALVIASSSVRIQAGDIDSTPTIFFADSPSLVSDRLTKGYIDTARAAKGTAADVPYLSSIGTAALINEATQAYEQERPADALIRYEEAARRPDGQQLRVFNGLYNSHLKLGHVQEAEQAFRQIVELGLATNNLAVRLLFNPGSTEFWRDPAVSAVYPNWLRQIALVTARGDYCLTVVGHTSRTGSEQINERLSLARARMVRELLLGSDRTLASRLDVSGMGWQANLIGSGTDDARDSLDRRVEFKVRSCTPR